MDIKNIDKNAAIAGALCVLSISLGTGIFHVISAFAAAYFFYLFVTKLKEEDWKSSPIIIVMGLDLI